jgi:twitching motility two-component system response regulator PilG
VADSFKVLVVDDDEMFLALVKHVFQVHKEAQVTDVQDATKVGELISAHTYDGIFLDLMMPGLDGFEVTKAIRKSELNKNTPIVIITARQDVAAMKQAHDAGATFVLTKPVDHIVLKKLFDTTKPAMAFQQTKRDKKFS